MPEPARQVEDAHARTRIEELAYRQGRRDADVDSRLLSHDRHLMRNDTVIEKLTASVGAIDEKLDALIAAQDKRDAVEADREKNHADREQRSQQGLTRLQTWALCIGVPVGFIAAVLSPFIAHWLH